jgi:hypothetical protein
MQRSSIIHKVYFLPNYVKSDHKMKFIKYWYNFIQKQDEFEMRCDYPTII